jgi:transposase-like protein
VTGEAILSRSNDPVPVETRLQIVLAVLAGETTIAEAARRHGVSAESINRWRNPQRLSDRARQRWPALSQVQLRDH